MGLPLYFSQNQWQSILYMLCAGIFMGVIFDISRCISMYYKSRLLIRIFSQIIIGIICFGILLLMLVKAHMLELRWWLFACAILGSTLYFVGPSYFVIKTSFIISKTLKLLWGKISRLPLFSHILK